MKTYYLYLDESKTNKTNITHFCLGGVAFEKTIYEEQITKSIRSLKTKIFGSTTYPLHEVDIRKASKENYKIFRKLEIRTTYWDSIKEILNSNDFKIFATAINSEKYKKYYDFQNTNNEYFIAFKIVLENFVHFLEKENAKGYIYIESTNPKNDDELRTIFHKIITDGSLFINNKAYLNRLVTINFIPKADQNNGLELADMIPGALNRKLSNLDPKKPSILDLINENIYDGTCELTERFGFKIMP